MRKVKKGDLVVIVSGKNKGASGKILRVVAGGLRVVVEGANLMKKHVKANPSAGVDGGIVLKEAPVHVSNVAILNPVTKKPGKIGVKTLSDGRKVRYFKSSGELVGEV